MSAKYFCDNCGAELEDREHGRIIRKRGKITVEVIRAVDACWNGGHACYACILKAVNTGKDIKP